MVCLLEVKNGRYLLVPVFEVESWGYLILHPSWERGLRFRFRVWYIRYTTAQLEAKQHGSNYSLLEPVFVTCDHDLNSTI